MITKLNIASCSILGRYLRGQCKFQETSLLICERYVFVQDIDNNKKKKNKNKNKNNKNKKNDKMCDYIYIGYVSWCYGEGWFTLFLQSLDQTSMSM